MTTVALSPFPVLRFCDNSGNALVGGKLFTYSAGTTTKLATYTDSSGATPNANPIILNSRGECNVWLTGGTSYKFVLSPSTDTDPPTNPIWTVDNINGTLATNFITPAQFGADPTGVTECSAAFQSFLNAIKDGGIVATWTGTYKVKRNVLTLRPTNPLTDTFGITLLGNVKFVSDGSASGPLLTIDHGTQTSTSGAFYRGLMIGSMYFDGTADGANANNHGLSILGVWQSTFDLITGNLMGGSTVFMPNTTFSGDPDPYSLFGVHFIGILGFNNGGYTFDSESPGGYAGNFVYALQATSCVLGGVKTNIGGNWWYNISCGNVQGWAMSFGTSGAASREYVDDCEFDGCQNGLRVQKGDWLELNRCRITTRFNINSSGTCWPLIAVQLGDVGGDQVNHFHGDFIFRIGKDTNINLGNLNTKFDFTNDANLVSNRIDIQLVDNNTVPLGVAWSNLVQNINTAADIHVMFNSEKVVDLRFARQAEIVSSVGAPTTVITTNGLNSAAALLQWGGSAQDRSGMLVNASLSGTAYTGFTAAATKLTMVGAQYRIGSPTLNKIFKIAICKISSGALTVLAELQRTAATTDPLDVAIMSAVFVNTGDVIVITGSNNDASYTVAAGIGEGTPNYFWVDQGNS